MLLREGEVLRRGTTRPTTPPRQPRRYRHTAYHKQTKNQWARDDPAFVVVCCVLVAIAAVAYCIT